MEFYIQLLLKLYILSEEEFDRGAIILIFCIPLVTADDLKIFHQYLTNTDQIILVGLI